MKFLSDILAKAGLTVDGVVTLNNTATGQTPASNDNSTKLATTAWVRTFVQPYSLPIASTSILGGIKVGTGLSIDAGSGILSVTGGGAASIKSTQTFTATAAQTVFTITGGYSVGLIDVFLNGVYLSPNQTTATNGTTVILGDAAAAGDIIDVIVASPVYEGATTTTDQLPEGVVNLYYTDARSRAAISLTVTGTSGASTYNSSTGVLNVPTYTLTGLGGVASTRTLTINGVTYDLTANRTWSALPTGGVAGQLLAKIDGTDYNAQWIDESPAASYTSQLKHEVKASQAISKGQAVYVSSADGTNMIVSKASNATEGTSSKTIGLLETSLSTNGKGNVITEGLLTGLNTASANAGDPVWLGTDGNLIYGLVNKPSAPAHLVFIGLVTRSNASNGEIFVKVQNGFEMKELHDYVESGVQNNFVISYESSTSLYKPKSIATLLGYTPANAARNLTINGTTYDLTADRTWTLTTSVIGEGTNLYYTDARVGTYLTANSYATQTYVNTAVSNLVDAAPGTLDTLNELAAALGDDPNFATTVATSIGTKEPAITAGTTGQYWRGDKSWQTLPVYTLSGLGGVPTTRTITINGTAQDLSADRTFTINSMVYPGAGIALSTGSAWGTSITDNSANWNTAFGWGNHASGGYLTTASAASTYASLTGAYANPAFVASLAWSKITGAPAFITSYTEVDTLATVTARGASTSTNSIFTGGLQARKNQTDNNYTTAALWTESYGNTTTGVAFHISGVVGKFLEMRTNGILYWENNQVWTSGTLTNLNQLTNGPGYITSYSETDTLATVTSRGASTSTNLSFTGNLSFGSSTRQMITLWGSVYGIGVQSGTQYYRADDNFAWFRDGVHSDTTFDPGSGGVLVMKLDSSSNLTVTGTIAASNFSGTHSGSSSGTNTGDQINISGNAATATNVAYSGLTGTVPTWNQNTTGSAATAGSSSFLSLQSASNLRTISTAGIYREEQPDSGYSYTTTLNMNSSDGRQQLTIERGGGGMKFRGSTSGSGDISWSDWRNVWHSSNLTNLNQLTNGPGYITGYTETDTLATVTARGATTTSTIIINGGAVHPLAISSSQRYQMQVRNTSNSINSGYGWWWFMDTNFNMGFHADGASDRFTLTRDGNLSVSGTLSGSNLSGTNTGDQTNISGYSASVIHSSARTDSASYNVVWAAGNPSQMYSCDAVRIQSSTGTIFATRSSAPMSATVANGNWDTSFSNTPVSTMAWGGDISSGGPTGTWWFQMNMRHSNASNLWGTQLAYGWEDNANQLYQRNVTGGSWSAWVRYLNSGNYNSYAPTLTGTGASGTWGINVTGTSSNITAYTINQSVGTGNAPTFTNIYNNAWFRTNNVNEGVYNQATGVHFYSHAATGWTITGSGGVVELVLRSNHQTTIRGYVYADTSNNIGLLTNDGNWGLQVDSSKNVKVFGADLTVGNTTSSNIYMTDTDESTRRIHCNSGRIGFLTTSNGWGAYCDNSGNWFANNLSGTNTGDQTNISGNAATATSAGSVSGLTLTSSANGINPDSVTQNQIGYNTSVSLFGQTDGGLYSSAYSSNWIHQIYGDFRTGQIAIRGKQNGTWQAWRTVWDSSNLTNLNQLTNGPGYITGASYVAGLNLQGLGSGSMNVNNGGSAVYRNENGLGGNLNYAPVLHLGGSDTMWQIQGDYYNSTDLRWRAGYAGTWYAWRQIIHTGNLGSYVLPITGGTLSGTLNFSQPVGLGFANGQYIKDNGNGGLIISSGAAVNINGTSVTMNTGLTVSGTTTLNSQVNINRHIDANTGWGSASGNTIFVGWSGGKVVLGSNANGGHDYARDITVASVVSTNPFFCFQDITAYSDARVKDDIQIVENAVEKIKAIRGVTYTRSDNVDKVKRHAGVLAQEVLKVLPEVVNGSEDSVYSVAYGNMAALFIEAIKEQQTQIESQKSEIDVLKDLVQQLINR